MGAVVFYPHSVLNFPSNLASNNQLKLGKPIWSLKDGPLAFASWKDVLQSSYSGRDSDGNSIDRPPKRSSAPRRTRKNDENKKSQFSDGKPPKSSSQEEILGLFRRIQSSISKKESANRNERNNKMGQAISTAESILEVLRQPGKQSKGTTKVEDASKVKARKQAMPNKDQTPQNYAQLSPAGKRITRPPSNFVKRSPIPSPSSPRGMAAQINNELLAATSIGRASESPKLEGMKLAELKKLAKSKGIRGYSKLKKGDLVELLRS